MCSCECCISAKIVHSSLLSCRYFYLKKLKDLSQNAQNRRSGGKETRIYGTYKNTVMPHGRHIYAKAYEMAKETICAYSHSDHPLPHWKYVLRCCDKFPGINITDQETYDQYPDNSLLIRFHIYHIIARCTKHGRILLTGKNFVASVNRILIQDNQQKYTQEKS